MRILEIRNSKDSLISRKVVKYAVKLLWIEQIVVIDNLICY